MVQRITSGLCAKGGDASERKPAMTACLTTGGSWGAATAAVAATRAAAVSHTIPTPALNVMSTSPAFHPVPAAADICVPVPSAEDATPVNQTVEIGTEVVSADSLKCWLAGVAKHDISGEDLAERLRAAMPETYED